ncbi:hypothetical protein GCM10029992_28290 [Glycomyces albus]
MTTTDTRPAGVTGARTGPRDAARRGRRGPASWYRGGGLHSLVFLLPLLIVFAVFSWIPIGRAILMSFQETNLVTDPTFVGLDNFQAVLADPLLWTAVKNTCYFALLALLFGYPVPLIAALLMSEVRRARGCSAPSPTCRSSSRPSSRCCCGSSSTTPDPTGCSTPFSVMSASARSPGSRTPTSPCPPSSSRRPGPRPVARSSSTWRP